MDIRGMYINGLKVKLLGDPKLRKKLRKAFKKRYQSTAQRITRSRLTVAVCRIAAKRILNQALKIRRDSAGKLLSMVREINRLVITSSLGPSCHTASSEPYFYDSAYKRIKRESPVAIDEQGRCYIAKEIEHDKKTGRPKKWHCTGECKLPTDDEISSILEAKDFFKLPIQELRHKLENIDSGCDNLHHIIPCSVMPCKCPSNEEELCEQLKGHPLTCTSGKCQSLLRILRKASVHHSILRRFLFLLYVARQHHLTVHAIDLCLCAADFKQLMELAGIEDYDHLFRCEVDAGAGKCDNVVPAYSLCGLSGLEADLQVEHAELITNLEKQISDDPEHACCSCERLLLRKQVTKFTFDDKKFSSAVWNQLKQYILHRDPNVKCQCLFVCQYCRPLLNKDKLPCRCILNGLETEPVPAEISDLDDLSRQLIQRAKAFQTVVRLGTYTAKVPTYNSLKACKGIMFFLPLPLNKTLGNHWRHQ